MTPNASQGNCESIPSLARNVFMHAAGKRTISKPCHVSLPLVTCMKVQLVKSVDPSAPYLEQHQLRSTEWVNILQGDCSDGRRNKASPHDVKLLCKSVQLYCLSKKVDCMYDTSWAHLPTQTVHRQEGYRKRQRHLQQLRQPTSSAFRLPKSASEGLVH